VWFIALDKMVPGGASPWLGLKRVFLDQTIAAPPLTYGFIWGIRCLETDFRDATTYTNSVIVEVMKMNYAIWPFTQFLCLTVIPLK
jgi:hypothetical protein